MNMRTQAIGLEGVLVEDARFDKGRTPNEVDGFAKFRRRGVSIIVEMQRVEDFEVFPGRVEIARLSVVLENYAKTRAAERLLMHARSRVSTGICDGCLG